MGPGPRLREAGVDSKVSGRKAPAGSGADDAIAAVVAMADARLPAGQAEDVARFVRRYHALTAAEDLAERAVEDLYGAALSHRQFAGEFAGGEAKLRVFNPRRDEHGWQSPHTVVEIVNDDMPFLVDSITMEINRQGLIVHLVVHPVMKVRRDAAHRLIGLADADGHDDAGDAGATDGTTDGRLESLIHVEVDRRTDPAQLDALRAGLQRILADVRKAVDDWPAMKQRIADVLSEVEQRPPPVPADELAEDLAFLRWLADDNFTLLGCRDYALVSGSDGDELRAVPGSGLGVLRESGDAAPSIAFAQMPAEMRAYARLPNLLTLTKANSRATVHRPGYLDYVGVKRFDADGNVVGERRVLGLYTSTAYNASPDAIPLLRSKVAAVRRRAGFLPHSHDAKALDTILEEYPRDELIQIGADDLYDIAIGILRLGERQRTRLFVRRDVFGRFHACLLYVPRENYDTRLRRRMQAMLGEAFQGLATDFTVHLSDSPLARILILVRTQPGAAPAVDLRELEQRLARLARRWEDELGQVLAERLGEERGKALLERYGDGFGAGYRDEHPPQMAVEDIERLDTLAQDDDLAMSLYRPPDAPAGQLRFRLYGAGTPAPLSRSLPILEHMGVQVLEERPFEIRQVDGRSLWIGDFGLSAAQAGEVEVASLRERFEQSFLHCWRGDCESDDFNRLVMLAGLDWRDVTILRAYARYMKQAAFTFSQAYIARTLAAHPSLAAALAALFRARFDPSADQGRAGREAELGGLIEAALEQVSSLDEDRILRQYLSLIRATLRTNFHRADEDGPRAGCLSFKLDPASIPLLPEPRPMFEIFVNSPRVEGVHLRGGKVARGGLRWSDRIEDFRTEVLGRV